MIALSEHAARKPALWFWLSGLACLLLIALVAVPTLAPRLAPVLHVLKTDADGYIRPAVSYKLDDHWTASLGANLFFGRDAHSFFGQFRDNTNAYAAIRYGF